MKRVISSFLAIVICLSLIPMTALAANTITVSLSPGPGGRVTGGGTYPVGSTVTATAIPDAGYLFEGWYENSYNGLTLMSSSETYTFTAETNYAGLAIRNVFARFELQPPPPPPEPQTYTIYAYASGGSVSGDGDYAEGSTVRLSITPDTDYNFIGWYEDGTLVSSNTTYTFTATSDRRLEARVLYKDATFDPYAPANPAAPPEESGYQYYEGKLISTRQDTAGRFITIETADGKWLSSELASGCAIFIDNAKSSFEKLTGDLNVALQVGQESGSVVRITATTRGVVLDGFTLLIEDGVLTKCIVTGEGGALVIPDGVTRIASNAFYACNWVTNITLPDSVTTIDSQAFTSCGDLAGITIPDSVTSIGDYAFSFCGRLTDITIPSSVTFLGEGAFNYCRGLKNVTLGNGLRSISSVLFRECDSLTSITIPASVVTISDAFVGCSSLERVWIPGGVSSMSGKAFDAVDDRDRVPLRAIHGLEGSYAEAYASKYNRPFSSRGSVPGIDSANDWARESIIGAYDKGFILPELQNDYASVITRAEFCRMAVKWVEYATGKTIDAVLSERGKHRDPNAFTDTNDSDVLAAFALGITSGTGEGKFTPNGQFNREQAATMIMNACAAIGAVTDGFEIAGFLDQGAAAGWARAGIGFVSQTGIMQGIGGDKFDPKATFTREQSILTFHRVPHIDLPRR